jgi:hypothetical protein
MVLVMSFWSAPLDRTPRQAIYRLLINTAKPCMAVHVLGLVVPPLAPITLPVGLLGVGCIIAAWKIGHPERWPLNASGDPP